MPLLLVKVRKFGLELCTLRRGAQKGFIEWNGIVEAIFFSIKLRQVLDRLQRFRISLRSFHPQIFRLFVLALLSAYRAQQSERVDIIWILVERGLEIVISLLQFAFANQGFDRRVCGRFCLGFQQAGSQAIASIEGRRR